MKSSQVRTCDHIGFFTNDADRLVEFYRRTLNFTVEREEILPASITRAVFGLSRPCRMIKLVPSGARGGFSPLKVEIFHPLGLRLARRRNAIVGQNHCSFSVRNLRAFLRRLRAGRVPLIQARRNGRTVFFLKDPDGNRIEIRES